MNVRIRERAPFLAGVLGLVLAASCSTEATKGSRLENTSTDPSGNAAVSGEDTAPDASPPSSSDREASDDSAVQGGIQIERDASLEETSDEKLPNSADGSCGQVEEQAATVVRPVDIILAIDNSGSMHEELDTVQEKMNEFVSTLEQSGLDIHLVLLSRTNPATPPFAPGRGICIPAPFGSGSCPDDSNLPRFRHVNQVVESSDALSLMLSTFRKWYGSMRLDSTKSFVVITDDDSSLSAADFASQLLTLWPSQPRMFRNWKFHGVYCLSAWDASKCPNGARKGTVYEQLRLATRGAVADMCEFGLGSGSAGNVDVDWSPVFNTLASAITEQSDLACAWAIPAPKSGKLDPRRVNVRLTLGDGTAVDIGKVPREQSCTEEGGWEYDDEVSPTRIQLCPETCNLVKAQTSAAVKVEFGCATRPSGPLR